MGSGARAERVAYGQVLGEAKAMQEHQLAMIPIMKEQAEMELGIKEQQFEMEVEQTKAMNLLSQQLQPDPVLLPASQMIASAPTGDPGSKNLLYVGLAILAYLLFKGKMK